MCDAILKTSELVANDEGSAQRIRRETIQQSTNRNGLKRIRLRIRIATFVGWRLRTFAKPDSDRPNKYNAFFERFNNQLS